MTHNNSVIRFLVQTLGLFTLAWCTGAAAAPGAHGPNGEHLDTAAQSAATTMAPGFEAKSELYELVARLDAGELSILIDRFDTNEPVLDASVEVESGELKARAKFHADLGDYAVDDTQMLKKLGTQGEHAVLITVVSGQESDLLEGVLRVGAAASMAQEHGHEPEPLPWMRWLLVLLAFVAAGLLLHWRRIMRRTSPSPVVDGGLA